MTAQLTRREWLRRMRLPKSSETSEVWVHLTRRAWLHRAGVFGGVLVAPDRLFSADDDDGKPSRGQVIGEPTAEKVGARVLADGGNAIDAIVAAALTAAVAAPYQTGIGGYGGCATLALAAGRRVVSIDFNTTAPCAARGDMFQLANGKPKADNKHGWLAAGVPGILAGLQRLLDCYGTWRFSDAVWPAMELARDGFVLTPSVASTISGAKSQFAADAGSRKLYLRDGEPVRAGERFCNPDLAELLRTLAQRGSVESFYCGDIALRIAEAFQKNGGLVTACDLSGYEAREECPLTLKFGQDTIHTAPLTAGGLTVLQALRLLEALDWPRRPAGLERDHAMIEALRLAWRDRLTLMGDPDFVNVPVERLMSAEYAGDGATKIDAVAKSGKMLTHAVRPREQSGTISLSAADRDGNLIALTLTHGDSYGARVTVDGLGLTLGHGMSRFDTEPRHPNAPGPGKRPLHNMCPTIVTRGGQPVLAIGGRGGRKIPNAVLMTLAQFVLVGQPLATSIAAPRAHTEGDTKLQLEKQWPAENAEQLRQLGYAVQTASSATLSAVAREQGELRAAMR